MRPRVALLLLALAAGGCGTSDAGTPERPAAPVSGAWFDQDPAEASLWLSFDDGPAPAGGATACPDDLDGPSTCRVVTANDGVLEPVPGAPGRGLGVAFPARCTALAGCPRAMVEVVPGAGLDPGEAAFAYGASVLLAPDQTSDGSNVVQQGRFGTTGGQWKLQVDGDAGNPSCVLRSADVVLRVRSSVSVADGAWHRVACRRDASGLTVAVDGTVDRVAGRTGSVSSAWPIRIGTPGVGDGDDQFHGRLDDVFLEIEPQA